MPFHMAPSPPIWNRPTTVPTWRRIHLDGESVTAAARSDVGAVGDLDRGVVRTAGAEVRAADNGERCDGRWASPRTPLAHRADVAVPQDAIGEQWCERAGDDLAGDGN